MITQRRSILKKMLASAIGVVGLGLAAKADGKKAIIGQQDQGDEQPQKEAFNVVNQDQVPLFSGSTKYGGLIFIAGKGAHFKGDIKSHTDHVLKELEKELINAGSSMEKVLKVNVYLNDIKDYQAMNEVYKGRFGNHPPVRTTVAVAMGGVPGDSMVEIDCIAGL